MRSFLRIVIIVTIVSQGEHIANAQEIFHQPSLPQLDSTQYSLLSFTRVLNTYVWTGDFRKALHGEVWDLDVHQYVRSRYVKTNQVAIQDEYQGFISLNTHLSENWNLQVKNTSNALADNRVIDLGKMAQHQILAGLQYAPAGQITGAGYAGFEQNSQEEEIDQGLVYALNFEAYRLKLDEFDASLASSWNQSFLGNRTPHAGVAKVILLRDFGGGIDDSLSFTYNTQRSEYYTSLSLHEQSIYETKHNIFHRNADLIEIMNQMKYDMDNNFVICASFGLSNRTIDRGFRWRDNLNSASIADSRIQEMQFYGTLSVQWLLLQWLSADVRLSYMERDERHPMGESADQYVEELRAQARKSENTAQRTMLMTALSADIDKYNKLRIISSASILRYDTPDEANTDDRDELLITSGLEISHLFSSRLLLRVSADLTLFHLVYLRREQSANNNWNKVVRLSPSVEYGPASWIRTITRAEVLANYTVSDYENQLASIRSFSFRQAFWSDSTVIKISKNITCNILGSLRIFERGILKWQEYKEKPEEYSVEKILWPEIVWSSNEGFNVGVGFRYFGQDRYQYRNNEKNIIQRVEAMGPTVFLEWVRREAERVTVSGWYEIQKNNGVQQATISNLSMQVGFFL